MSNAKKICEPKLTYHKFSRCIEKKMLMKTDKMKRLMIDVLKKALEKYKFELINYTIMNNHFHFLIRTVNKEDTISKIMQFIKARYAQKYNSMMNRCGPFWNERFKDTIVENKEYPEKVFNNINTYIILNPVKAGIVKNARDYEYGCINFFLDENYNPPVKLTYHKYFKKLGSTFDKRIQNFLKLESDYLEKISSDKDFDIF